MAVSVAVVTVHCYVCLAHSDIVTMAQVPHVSVAWAGIVVRADTGAAAVPHQVPNTVGVGERPFGYTCTRVSASGGVACGVVAPKMGSHTPGYSCTMTRSH